MQYIHNEILGINLKVNHFLYSNNFVNSDNNSTSEFWKKNETTLLNLHTINQV